MTVNKNYRDIAYPVDPFQPLDQGWSTKPANAPGGSDESIQTSWNPVSGLDTVATDLATFSPTSSTPVGTCILNGGFGCTGNSGYANPRVPGQPIGQRVGNSPGPPTPGPPPAVP